MTFVRHRKECGKLQGYTFWEGPNRGYSGKYFLALSNELEKNGYGADEELGYSIQTFLGPLVSNLLRHFLVLRYLHHPRKVQPSRRLVPTTHTTLTQTMTRCPLSSEHAPRTILLQEWTLTPRGIPNRSRVHMLRARGVCTRIPVGSSYYRNL